MIEKVLISWLLTSAPYISFSVQRTVSKLFLIGQIVSYACFFEAVRVIWTHLCITGWTVISARQAHVELLISTSLHHTSLFPLVCANCESHFSHITKSWATILLSVSPYGILSWSYCTSAKRSRCCCNLSIMLWSCFSFGSSCQKELFAIKVLST